MVSGKFVHLIEEHGDQIITSVLSELRAAGPATQASRLLESELRDSGRDLLRNLGEWLSPEGKAQLGKRYERLGETIWEQNVPLHETLRGLFLIRDKAEDYIEEHMLTKTQIELYAEEQTDKALARMFAGLVVRVAHGYERAARGQKAAHSLTG
jgi:hypothetical protein